MASTMTRSICIPDNIAFMHEANQHSPHHLTRKFLHILNTQRTALWVMLKLELHMLPYKTQAFQELSEEDK